MQIQTPVNDKIDQAILAVSKAAHEANVSRDWNTAYQLDQIFDNLKRIKEETRESQINSVDEFVKSFR